MVGKSTRYARLAAAVILCGVARSAAAGQFEWKSGFEYPGGNGLDNDVRAFAVFDDGNGPALYAGGRFQMAGGTPAGGIARWDGTTWTAPGNGTNGQVLALTVFDDGTGPALYCGGFFSMAGDTPANGIAKWDGSTWSPVGGGVTYRQSTGIVQALTVFDDGRGPALYAGGVFDTAGGVPADQIAKWDGSAWSPLGMSLVAEVESLAVFDDGNGPALYAGGYAGYCVTKWDGSTWSALGSGILCAPGDVFALAVFDAGDGPALYAGGNFRTAGDVPARNIAKWDGANWAPLGSGVGPPTSVDWVEALTVFDDGAGAALYAGGYFSMAGGRFAFGVAKWDGATWSDLDAGLVGSVYALAGFDAGAGPALYAGGYIFRTLHGIDSSHIAKWAAQD
jgi:hypothetical protein